MVYSDKGGKSIYVRCSCGIEGIHIDKCNCEPEEYFLSMSISADNIIDKIKMAWSILRHGLYNFSEVCLSASEFNELKELIAKYK